MKKLYALLPVILLLSVITVSNIYAQGVGVNNSNTAPHPTAMLHVDLGADLDKGFLITGISTPGSSSPDLGAGSRLMFYPAKCAFRAGNVTDDRWDNLNVGRHSVAMGFNTTANGQVSTALGTASTASGNNSMSIGYFTVASGNASTALGAGAVASGSTSIALGLNVTASGAQSTALGSNTNAVGFASTAMGRETIAFGSYSTAMGTNTSAQGDYSTAIGYSTTASGEYSIAMGYNSHASGLLSLAAGTNVSTNNKRGAFFFGDGDPNVKGVRSIGFADQFAARFNGGYYFISSDAGADIGVQVLAGGNAWVAMCDKHRKENFEPLNGEDILQKMKEMKFSSWNYKTQDPAQHRHYGIMAQDFFNAFGHDKYGNIGNDSTVNPIDMIGIDMAAIQALEKRTAQLALENIELKNEMNDLKRRLDSIERKTKKGRQR